MKLYTYWRSSAAYRVRIGLNLKGIAYDSVGVNLIKDGGEQHAPEYTALNPSHLVPTLVLDDGSVLTQSLAILDYLDATHPEPPLLPQEPLERARQQSAAYVIAMDVHPINNSRVVTRLGDQFSASMDDRIDWMNHWMTLGFTALEQMVRKDTAFAFGDMPGLVDICLVAQFYNARRWGCDLAPFPRLVDIEQRCLALDAFDAARPENQPDAE